MTAKGKQKNERAREPKAKSDKNEKRENNEINAAKMSNESSSVALFKCAPNIYSLSLSVAAAACPLWPHLVPHADTMAVASLPRCWLVVNTLITYYTEYGYTILHNPFHCFLNIVAACPLACPSMSVCEWQTRR